MSTKSAILWVDTVSEPRSFEALAGDVRADVAVIGGGIMGTATALTLASRGVSVLLLEARWVGSGASSRPGGFVVPTFPLDDPRSVVDELGETGERLVDLVGGAASCVYELVRKHGIRCDAAQGGWYQPAHSGAAWRRMRQVADDWAAVGFEFQLFDSAETERRTGVAGYVGSCLATSGGTLQPLSYTLGLANAAVRAGARIFEHAQVSSVERGEGKLTLTVGSGRAIVERAILCTNGRSMGIYKPLQRSLIPLRIWQCATEPLEPSARFRLFQHGECLSDTCENLFTYRFDRDDRLITGMLAPLGATANVAAAVMARRLRVRLRLSHIPRIDYIWSGTASVTRNRLPQLSVFPDGVIAAVACNGRGIAMSTAVGQAIAKFALDGQTNELPLPVSTPSGEIRALLERIAAPLYPYYGIVKDLTATR